MIRSKAATDRFARAWVTGMVVLAFLAGAPAAHAQAQNASIAEQLFLEGKALMQAKQYAAACDKLKASHDLDRSATGTLLNLATCHELLGKPATAWAEYRQAAAESAGRRPDRVALAREHEAKLLPTLSRIRVFVPPDARADGLVLRLDDGAIIPPASWGTELPIDPGKHLLEASAPKKLPRSFAFVVGSNADRQVVTVEPLTDAPVDHTAEDAARERERLAALRGRRVVGYALGGVGLAAIGVGLAVGLAASNENKDVARTCPNDACANAGAQSQAESSLSSAKTLATVSNITTGVGALLVASGLVVVLTARPGKPSSALRVSPSPLAGGGGLLFTGEL